MKLQTFIGPLAFALFLMPIQLLHLTKKTDKVVGSHKKYIITIKWKVVL